tara:strand:- start:1346 stop:3289 length:1944 start_codon:yes stop_codon:yes gene_type:complete
MSRELLEKEIARRNLLKQGFTLDKIEEEINKRNAQKLENSDRGFSGIIDDIDIPESNARSKAVEEYLTSPAFGRLVLEVGGGVLGTAFAPQIGLPLYIGRAAAFVRPALQQVVTRMSGAGIGEAGGALASQSFDPRESVSKEMLRAFVTGATAEGVGTIATKAVGKVLGKNKKLIEGAEEAVETIEQQRKKIILNPKDYDQKVREATKNGILTPGLLQEGQLVDLLENLSELSLFGGGSVRYAREGAETLASSGITDYVKSLRTVGDLEDLGNLFQKTLSDDLTNFKRASNRKYFKLDNALKKNNPNAVNISAIKTAAKERLKKIGLPGTNPALEKDLIAITKLPDLINFSKANSVRSDFLSRSRNISDQFGNVNKQFATEYGKKFTTAMDEAKIPESVRIAYDDAQSFYKNGAEVFNTKLFKKIIENDPDVVYKSIVAAGDRPVLVRRTFDILDKRIKDTAVRANLKTALRGEFLDDAIRNSQKSNVQYGQELDATKLDNFFAKKSMMMKELFEPEQLKNIEKLKNALAFSQGKLRKKGGLPGAIFIQMKQSGAVMTLTKLGAIGGGGAIGGVPAAATILLAPGILGKMFTSPKIVKLLTTGFRYNENQTIAGRTFRQIIAQMSKEGLIDEDEKDQALKDIKQGGY